MRFFVLPLLLAAAVSAEVFQFVGQHGQHGGSAVYGVRGGVTVGVQKLTGEKTALEYNGTLALEQVREGEYLAMFTQFTLGKYDKINRNIHDEALGNLKPEEQRLVKALHEQGGQYAHEMQKPVKFFMKEGKVVRMEAEKGHQQWSLNIFRGVLTLLQNQVRKPTNLAVPFVEYNYEDGVTGNCRVQYEIIREPEDETVHDVYNMTKTYNYKDCIGRPVYLHLKDVHRGCAGVCDNHKPENFLNQYEEEQTDYELKPTPGCPVNQQRKDSLVSVQTVAKYNVTKGLLEEARTQSTDIYRLFGGEIEVFTRLQLRLRNHQGPKVQEPKNTQVYETLQQRLPIQEEEELDIPVYALMKEHAKHQQYPEYFRKHFDAVVRELRELHGKRGHMEQQAFDSPAYLVELIQAISGMTEEEIKKTMPEVVRQHQPHQLTEEQQVRRQLWIELIGKAGSKSAVKIAVELIKNKTFTPAEARRVLQDIAAFQSYPDTEMIEQVLGLCMKHEGLTATGKATACAAAGKIISKASNSKVYQWAQKKELAKKIPQQGEKYMNVDKTEPESEEYEMTMGHLAIKPELRVTPEKLQQYVQRLSQALRQSTDFKDVVAYINGLAKIEKPEVLPELIQYVEGTAPNMHQIREQGEKQEESKEFVRRVAIVALRNIATKYPKEVNPILRVVFLNTTETVQTRLQAFDGWMNTQPAQWEVEKVMQVTNKDTSVELTHYVYTALKAAMKAEEPCYQLLAHRIRAAWGQIRPFDFGMKFSQLRSKSYYNTIEDYGIRGIWKLVTSNTTFLPTFGETKIEQVRGPFMKTFFGAKLLVKGGEKAWEQLVGKDGLLERIAIALDGQVKNGQQQQIMKDIAEGMGMKYEKETPKAVLFWKFFSGEAIVPIDAQYAKELKQALLQTVTKFGKQGATGHFMRVFVPTKAFHVEPSALGLPIVHSTIHPIVVSVRYENLKLRLNTQEGRIAPETFELTGTIQPTVLSLRQSRVFVAEKEGQYTPTLKISDVKEFNVRLALRVAYEKTQQRLKINVKPQFERVLHSGHCTELKLQKNTIIDEQPTTNVLSYDKCVKSLRQPIRREQKFGGKTGMVLRVSGESHQPWSGLPMFGAKDTRREGLFGAVLNRLANKGMKHHAISLYLEPAQQKPVNEWAITIDMDSNVEALSKIPAEQQVQRIQKIKVQYKPRQQEQLNSELQQVIRKAENLLQKFAEELKETTIEKQMLIKIEGRHQGQPQRTLKVAMKKIHNLEKTQQQFALVAESQDSRKAIEVFANVSYPQIGSPFRFEPSYISEDERMNATLIAQFQGQQEQTYRVKFEAKKSEEQKKEHELKWFEVRALAEQKAGKNGITDAAKKALIKDNSLDNMEMTIQLPAQIHPQAKQVAKQLLQALKYKFAPQMRSEIAGRLDEQLKHKRSEQREIHISANATRKFERALLYNVRVEMPRENVTFENIRLHGVRPVNMQQSALEQIKSMMVRDTHNHVCIVGNKGVRTYDNVTFGLDVKPHCDYVLTRDHTEGKRDFTVTFQVVDPTTYAKKVHVQVGKIDIVLEPFTTGERVFYIHVDGRRLPLVFEKPMILPYGQGKRVFINAFDVSNTHDHPVITIFTENKEFTLMYNGHATRVFLASKYHGQVNGICGNFDNERTHEFIGPNGHEYEHSNEFIAAYGVGQNCKTPVQNTKEQLMQKIDEELKQIREREQKKWERMSEQMREQYKYKSQPEHWQRELQEDLFNNDEFRGIDGRMASNWEQKKTVQEEREVLKTAMSVEGGHLCFSVEPVPTCKEGYHKEGLRRTERVESICLDRTHPKAIKAMHDVRQGLSVDIAALEPHQKGRLVTMQNIPKCVRYD